MKRYLWIVVALAATLVFALTALARLPSNQVSSRGIYIQYDNVFDNIDRDHGFPVAGGHKRWGWNELEPTLGNYQFDQVRSFVTAQGGRGKKAALGLETFVGRINQSPPYGSLAVPAWLWQTYPNVALWNTRGGGTAWYTLNYLDANYQAKYRDFIYAFADWLAANSDVAANVGWVEMGVGMYSETQPSDQWVTQNWPDYVFYADAPPAGLGWSGNDWLAYVNWCTDTYYHAFRVRNPSLSFIPLFLNCAPDFKGVRDAFADYAGAKGVGLKNNGLQVDRFPYYLYGPLEKWGSVVAPGVVPIAWETYEQWLTNETELYWGLLCALDKIPDVMEPDRWLMVDHSYNPRPNYVAIWQWVEPYLGVTPSTTPGIWCALRETEHPSNGEPGNFNFWLFERPDLAGGATVAAWNVTPFKEGRYTRRTDQGTGNRYMHFQVLNPSTFYASPGEVTVHVTYLDAGTDWWKLTYDSTTGEQDAVMVQKTNTNTWKKASVTLVDARFGNGRGPGGSGPSPDLKIDCLNDGDEYIHMIEVNKGSGGPTPTPTETVSASAIQGSVTLQRPNQPPPSPSWSVPLTVMVGGTPHAVTTDQSGNFTLSGLTPGTYDISVKNPHTLRNIKTGVTLAAGTTHPLGFGTLLEGDASDDNCVNIIDFSILKTGFIPGYDARADFNQDGYVNISDFSLLKLNFGLCGDVPVGGSGGGAPAQQAVRTETAAGTVQVSIKPVSSLVIEDQVFAVDIQVAADGQPVDGVEVHLDFDPLYLEVVNTDGDPAGAIESGGALDVLLRNYANNVDGEIDFAAGTFSTMPPSGSFALATIRFKALRPTGENSTHLAFITQLPRKTDVTHAGGSVLAGTTSGSMTISTVGRKYSIYLPFVPE